jgi:hypothetical protein
MIYDSAGRSMFYDSTGSTYGIADRPFSSTKVVSLNFNSPRLIDENPSLGKILSCQYLPAYNRADAASLQSVLGDT